MDIASAVVIGLFIVVSIGCCLGYVKLAGMSAGLAMLCGIPTGFVLVFGLIVIASKLSDRKG